MMKMKNDKRSPAWCSFSNYRSRLILGYLKFWRCRKKNVGCRKKKPNEAIESPNRGGPTKGQ